MTLPEFTALAAKGHKVGSMLETDGPQLVDADLILGPQCWRMLPELVKYLEAAIKGARATAYPKKES